VSHIAYQGHGPEIEDDVVRLRRRRLEFSADAGRRIVPGRTPLRRVLRRRRASLG
jgi:hypothetical protein